MATSATILFTRAVNFLSRAFSLFGGGIGIIIFALTELALLFGDQIAEFLGFGNAAEEATDSVEGLEESLSALQIQAEDTAGELRDVFGFTASQSAANRLLVTIGEITQAEFDRLEALDQANRLREDGLITQNQYLAAVRQLTEEFENANSTLGEVRESIESNLGDTLANAFERGRLSLRDFTRSVLSDIIRIQARIAASNIVSSIFSGGFGGFRQQGGPVTAGQAYVVGENGPELFVPRASGTVIPNGGGGASGGVTNNYYTIEAVDARSFEQLLARDPRSVANIVRRGQRQQGAFV